jgi:hypothetical protein
MAESFFAATAPPAAERGPSAADRELDDGARNWLIVSIAHFDNRRDGGLLLNDIDGVLAVDDHDAQAGRRRLRLHL